VWVRIFSQSTGLDFATTAQAIRWVFPQRLRSACDWCDARLTNARNSSGKRLGARLGSKAMHNIEKARGLAEPEAVDKMERRLGRDDGNVPNEIDNPAMNQMALGRNQSRQHRRRQVRRVDMGFCKQRRLALIAGAIISPGRFRSAVCRRCRQLVRATRSLRMLARSGEGQVNPAAPSGRKHQKKAADQNQGDSWYTQHTHALYYGRTYRPLQIIPSHSFEVYIENRSSTRVTGTSKASGSRQSTKAARESSKWRVPQPTSRSSKKIKAAMLAALQKGAAIFGVRRASPLWFFFFTTPQSPRRIR
jgi:hypothetical protein